MAMHSYSVGYRFRPLPTIDELPELYMDDDSSSSNSSSCSSGSSSVPLSPQSAFLDRNAPATPLFSTAYADASTTTTIIRPVPVYAAAMLTPMSATMPARVGVGRPMRVMEPAYQYFRMQSGYRNLSSAASRPASASSALLSAPASASDSASVAGSVFSASSTSSPATSSLGSRAPSSVASLSLRRQPHQADNHYYSSTTDAANGNASNSAKGNANDSDSGKYDICNDSDSNGNDTNAGPAAAAQIQLASGSRRAAMPLSARIALVSLLFRGVLLSFVLFVICYFEGAMAERGMDFEPHEQVCEFSGVDDDNDDVDIDA